MAGNQKKKHSNNGFRIDVSKQEELWYWSREFGCTAKKLREVVDEVGPLAQDVKAWLVRNK